MPGKLPKRPYTEMMAFEKFLQWRAAEQMRFRAEIIKRADPTHIVTGHGAQPSAHMAGDAENHAINRGNDWDLVKPLDGVGCSHFPFWFAMSDADFGVRVECTRSAAGDKTVWVSELQGGSARQGFRRAALGGSQTATALGVERLRSRSQGGDLLVLAR